MSYPPQQPDPYQQQPGYGQQPGYPPQPGAGGFQPPLPPGMPGAALPPPRNPNRQLLILGGIGGGAVFLVLVLMLVLLLGGGGPEGAVSSAIKAVEQGDADALIEVTCDADLEDGGEAGIREGMSLATSMIPDFEWDIKGVKDEKDDEATVEVEFTYEDPDTGDTETDEEEIHVVKEDGDWKICDSVMGF